VATGSRSGCRYTAFALGALASQLARPTNGLSLLARPLLGRLFIKIAQLHLAEYTLALKLLFQGPKRLINIVIAYNYLQRSSALSKLIKICWIKTPGS